MKPLPVTNVTYDIVTMPIDDLIGIMRLPEEKRDCDICHRVNCICDEETEKLMERERDCEG